MISYVLQTKSGDIMGSSSQNVLSSLGDSLLGTITIDLNAISYDDFATN